MMILEILLIIKMKVNDSRITFMTYPVWGRRQYPEIDEYMIFDILYLRQILVSPFLISFPSFYSPRPSPPPSLSLFTRYKRGRKLHICAHLHHFTQPTQARHAYIYTNDLDVLKLTIFSRT